MQQTNLTFLWITTVLQQKQPKETKRPAVAEFTCDTLVRGTEDTEFSKLLSQNIKLLNQIILLGGQKKTEHKERGALKPIKFCP